MERQELDVPGTWPDAEKVVIASTEFDDGKMLVEVVGAKDKEEAMVHELHVDPVEPEEVQTPDTPVRRRFEDRKGAWKNLPVKVLQRSVQLRDQTKPFPIGEKGGSPLKHIANDSHALQYPLPR